MINCFQFCYNFALNFNLRRYSMAQKVEFLGRAVQLDPGLTALGLSA